MNLGRRHGHQCETRGNGHNCVMSFHIMIHELVIKLAENTLRKGNSRVTNPRINVLTNRANVCLLPLKELKKKYLTQSLL